jgi:hypothetical protein
MNFLLAIIQLKLRAPSNCEPRSEPAISAKPDAKLEPLRTARNRMRGRPFKKGESGNPGERRRANKSRQGFNSRLAVPIYFL